QADTTPTAPGTRDRYGYSTHRATGRPGLASAPLCCTASSTTGHTGRSESAATDDRAPVVDRIGTAARNERRRRMAEPRAARQKPRPARQHPTPQGPSCSPATPCERPVEIHHTGTNRAPLGNLPDQHEIALRHGIHERVFGHSAEQGFGNLIDRQIMREEYVLPFCDDLTDRGDRRD